MANYTENLNLFKYDTVADSQVPFSINDALNQNWDILDEAFNNKADTDLTNTTNQGYIKMAGASMPSNTYVTLTIGSSGATYTAPANGWFAYRIQVAKATTSAASYVSLFNETAVTSLVLQGNIQGAAILRGYIPVNKGHVVAVTYAYRTNDANDYLVFVYAEGSKGEA